MFQLFMILAVATSLVRQTQPSASPFAYYSSAIQYADILSEPPCDAQIQNTMLLLVFSHLNDISSMENPCPVCLLPSGGVS
jgi:hypothetical protein